MLLKPIWSRQLICTGQLIIRFYYQNYPMNQVYFLKTPKGKIQISKGCYLTLKKKKFDCFDQDLIKVVRKPIKKTVNPKKSALTAYTINEDQSVFLSQLISPRLKTLPVFQDQMVYIFDNTKPTNRNFNNCSIREDIQMMQFLEQPESGWEQIATAQRLMQIEVNLAAFDNKKNEEPNKVAKPYYNTRSHTKNQKSEINFQTRGYTEEI